MFIIGPYGLVVVFVGLVVCTVMLPDGSTYVTPTPDIGHNMSRARVVLEFPVVDSAR